MKSGYRFYFLLASVIFLFLSIEGNIISDKINLDFESRLVLKEKNNSDCTDHKNDKSSKKFFIFLSNYQVGINKLDIDAKSFYSNKWDSSSISIICQYLTIIPYPRENFLEIQDLRILYKSFLC